MERIPMLAPIEPSACRREEGRLCRPRYMRKWIGIFLCLATAVLLLLCGAAAAETDPIVCEMELSPNKLTGPGPVNVTITISNSGSEDMKDPVVLYDPAAQIVSDFGTNGAVILKAGESKTWTGTYDVTQRMLENGSVMYYAMYTLYKESGEAVSQSKSIVQPISLLTAEAGIDVSRSISPTIATEGQNIVVAYEISNVGTVSLWDVTIQENKDIYKEKQTIPELKSGQTASVKFPVTMGKKDLTSGATITYKTEENGKAQTYTVENQKITYGEASLSATLSSSSKGVVENGTITLTLALKNSGSVDYSDIRVTDETLGDVFTNQELKAGKSLTLEKEVTVPATQKYQFTVTATDATGTETSIVTDALTITAVDPSEALNLSVLVTPDRTEVFEQPGLVRFTIDITNDSAVEAKNVTVSHGDTKLYTFDSIAAGETRTLSRDTALSMAGKYRFTVTAQDPLENKLTFESNEMQIAFSVPTPAPATPTPAPNPTPEPTFEAATIPPISDRSVGTVPKTIQMVLIPITVIAGLLLIGCCVLLIIATKRRADQKKASENAVDQLERAKRRDYVSPAVEEAPEEEKAAQEAVSIDSRALEDDISEEELELPHLKYARSARPAEPEEKEDYSAINSGLYDESMTGDLGAAEDADYDRMAYAVPEDSEYADSYEEDYQDDAYSQDGALQETAEDFDAYDGDLDAGYSDGYDDGYYDENPDAGSFDEEDAGDVVDGHVPDDRVSADAYDSDAIFRRPREAEKPAPRSRRSRRDHDENI